MGARRAELAEAEGHPGFTALPHPSLLLGAPGCPGLWDEGLQAVLGALRGMCPLSAHPGQAPEQIPLCVVGTRECAASGTLCSILGSLISLS